LTVHYYYMIRGTFKKRRNGMNRTTIELSYTALHS
jgi:hypothetical protein